MNAKELIEAAKYFAVHRSCECDPSVGIVNCMGCDIARLADHILATVREDDDEPVTLERLEADGWACRYEAWINMDCPSLQITFPNEVAWVGIGNAKLKMGMPLTSMGHLRRLVAALGE